MVKNRLKTTALLVLTLLATMATAQTVNMSKYITLTVTQGQSIRLSLQAAADSTPVKIVSGSTDTVVTVGASWTGSQSYTAGATTMTVYGDITGFDCSANSTKLTALDVSKNVSLLDLRCWGNKLTALDLTQNTTLTKLDCWGNLLTTLNVIPNIALTWLDCGSNLLTALDVTPNTALTNLICDGNSFTTQAFDDLMCSLPTRVVTDSAIFFPLWNDSDTTAADFMAATSQIATGKNWQVRYLEGNQDEIPATTGTYTCPTTTGIGEVASVVLAIYPNPATDILTIETAATGSDITITDLSGRVVLTATATDGNTTLNISHLSAGTYMVRVETNGERGEGRGKEN